MKFDRNHVFSEISSNEFPFRYVTHPWPSGGKCVFCEMNIDDVAEDSGDDDNEAINENEDWELMDLIDTVLNDDQGFEIVSAQASSQRRGSDFIQNLLNINDILPSHNLAEILKMNNFSDPDISNPDSLGMLFNIYVKISSVDQVCIRKIFIRRISLFL